MSNNTTISMINASETTMNFLASGLIIVANLLVVVALRYMRSAKKATIMFLAQLAISNLMQGIVFFLRGFFSIWPVINQTGCMSMAALSMACSGTYVTAILYVYLDLYLNLKKMSVYKPVISTSMALGMIALGWVFWLGLGAVGYAFGNKDWHYVAGNACSLESGAYKIGYSITVCCLFFAAFVVILICHIGTIKVMHRAFSKMSQTPATQSSSNETANTNGTTFIEVQTISSKMLEDGESQSSISHPPPSSKPTKPRSQNDSHQSKWLKKNASVVRLIMLVLIIFVLCWYPTLMLVIVVVLCSDCLPGPVIFAINILVIIQYISNGFIYLVKSPEFLRACKRLFCCCCKGYRQVRPLGRSGEGDINASDAGSSVQ